MVKLLRTTSINPDFNKLTALLDKELWERYGEDQGAYEAHDRIVDNDTVIIGYERGEPVACGCFKKSIDRAAELKRMFVRPDHRGKGLAFLVLHEVEQWAREQDFKRVILETGVKQPEAISLYEKAGYKRIPNFPPYTEMPLSICMEKVL